MRYYVAAGERSVEVDVDGDEITVDGVTVRARLERDGVTDGYTVHVGDAVYRLRARRAEGPGRGRYELSIDGFRLAVEALDERARAIRELSRSTERPAGPTRLTAPMPGLVVRVSVTDGERVRAGQGLVVMEAMKMENELKAASAGIVRRIAVSAGSAVEKGALLLELEASDENH